MTVKNTQQGDQRLVRRTHRKAFGESLDLDAWQSIGLFVFRTSAKEDGMSAGMYEGHQIVTTTYSIFGSPFSWRYRIHSQVAERAVAASSWTA